MRVMLEIWKNEGENEIGIRNEDINLFRDKYRRDEAATEDETICTTSLNAFVICSLPPQQTREEALEISDDAC